MSWHRVSPYPFLSSSSSLTTQIPYTNSYTYSHPNLNFLQHYTGTLPTRNVVSPSGALFESRPHLTPPIRLVRNPKRVIVPWIGIRTRTMTSAVTSRTRLDSFAEKRHSPAHSEVHNSTITKFSYIYVCSNSNTFLVSAIDQCNLHVASRKVTLLACYE